MGLHNKELQHFTVDTHHEFFLREPLGHLLVECSVLAGRLDQLQ